jgi:hypothetical protein
LGPLEFDGVQKVPSIDIQQDAAVGLYRLRRRFSRSMALTGATRAWIPARVHAPCPYCGSPNTMGWMADQPWLGSEAVCGGEDHDRSAADLRVLSAARLHQRESGEENSAPLPQADIGAQSGCGAMQRGELQTTSVRTLP